MAITNEARQEFKTYTMTEVAELLGVTYRTIRSYVMTGKLKAVKIGGMWKISEDNLRKFINGES